MKSVPSRNSRTHSRSRSCNRGSSTYVPPPPPMPPRPTLEEYKVPKPTFNSDLQRVSKFNYFFGVDKFEFKKEQINNNCCFISKEIEIDNADEIGIDVSYSSKDNTSVEFYIIKDDIEYPIVPENDNGIKNELIFFNMNTRIPYVGIPKIKRDGIDTNLSIDEANKLSDAIYTISYDVEQNKRIAINNKFKLKIVLRRYDDKAEAPYVNNVILKAYGGGKLWLYI